MKTWQRRYRLQKRQNRRTVLPLYLKERHVLFCCFVFCWSYIGNRFAAFVGNDGLFGSCVAACVPVLAPPRPRRVLLGWFSSCCHVFTVDFVEVNQFDHCYFGIITYSCTQFDDAGISTGTACHFWRYHGK